MSTANLFKTYSNRSNARRAAKAANLADGEYKLVTHLGGKTDLVDARQPQPEPAAEPAPTKATVPSRKREREQQAKRTSKPAPSANPKTKPVVHNRITESACDKPTKRVWHIADSMPNAKRAAVLQACADAGIAYYTARTQYQLWKATLSKSKT